MNARLRTTNSSSLANARAPLVLFARGPKPEHNESLDWAWTFLPSEIDFRVGGAYRG